MPKLTKTKIRQLAVEQVSEDHGLSPTELKALLASAKYKPRDNKKCIGPKTKTRSIKFLGITDTHIGHEKFHEELFEEAVRDSRDCDFIIHGGDHLEGMSGRPGHIYELSQIGYQAQMKRCKELYQMFPHEKPIYGIDGNHDQWYKQKNDAGMVVGADLQDHLKNYTHLGEWEGDLKIDNLWIKLFHANDGSSYAMSYKMQKLVESFSGGEKPNIVFQGHYHKALYQFIRNVHAYDGGTICGQSRYMRGKKLAAHMGYWVITARWNKSGINSIVSEFHPWYE